MAKRKAGVPKLSDRLRGRQVPHIGVLGREDLEEIINLGEWFRDHKEDWAYVDLLRGRVQVLLFVYESTRTRMGFETAMAQLGGTTVYLSAKETQMGRGESLADTARALDQYMDVFAGRLWSQDDMDTVAKNTHCPVMNACTPVDHCTHVIGELMCIKKAKGKLEGLNLVYTGMARGILHSFIRVCPVLGMNLVLAIPESYARTVKQDIWAEGKGLAKKAGTRLEIVTNLKKAVVGADFIQASTLIRSMLAGEQSPEEKEVMVADWTVTGEVLACAKPDVLYSHSGPAHRNVCATSEVMDGPKSLIPEEANNAIYSKKAMLALTVK
jgi:ornithine carbamoyltransferase